MQYMTARNYANTYAGNPVDGLLYLDIEKANAKPSKKFDAFYNEATARLEQIIKDAAIYAAMP